MTVGNARRPHRRRLPHARPASSPTSTRAFDITTTATTSCSPTRSPTSAYFVEPGGVIDQEAWRRPPSTCPRARRVSRGAVRCRQLCAWTGASAVVFTVVVAGDGTVTLRWSGRSSQPRRSPTTRSPPPICRRRSPRTGRPQKMPAARRVVFPSRSWSTAAGVELRFARRLASEDQNAGMSLATNPPSPGCWRRCTGIFASWTPQGTTPSRLRRTCGLGLHWPRNQTLAAFERSLRPDERAGNVPARRAPCRWGDLCPVSRASCRGIRRWRRPHPRHGPVASTRRSLRGRRRAGAGQRRCPAASPTPSSACRR